MNKMLKRLAALMLLAVVSVTTEISAEEPSLAYYDALQFRMINKGYDDTATPYSRLPQFMEDSVRTDLWYLAGCSTGLAIRFSTNSTRIGVRYNLLRNFHMPHMADTGIKGTDLYRLSDEGVWEYVNTNRPTKDSIQTKLYVENLKGDMREFMIYLPLYDGVNWMEIGVDSSATISKPQVDNPRKSKKIVFYGTSIMQGGCATRTAMVTTNMLQRDLNCECINLGFSGQGKMDMCMARVMASIPDVSAYVIDPVPNCTEMMCDTLTYDFVKILRTLRPEVPIVMVEGFMYPYAKFDSFFGEYLPKKNAAFRKNYEKLKAENPDNLYYLDCDGIVGYDNEATVDGVHYTDIGFRRYADKLLPILRPFVE